jgi:hypothetical protein
VREELLPLTLPSPPLGERDLKGCTVGFSSFPRRERNLEERMVTFFSSLSPVAGERVG